MKDCRSSSRTKDRATEGIPGAFTLIERLLVIVMLAAMLLPVRSRASQANCIRQLKQIGSLHSC